MTKLKYIAEPKNDGFRCGCKVSWSYFKTKEAADKAVLIAKNNAEVAWNEGYDFGYQSPGSLRLVPEDGFPEQYRGLYEVCFP